MERKPVKLWHLTRRLGLLWVGFPLIFAVVFSGAGIALTSKAALLDREGVLIEGIVLDKRIERRSTNDGYETDHILIYQYQPPERLEPIEKRATVHASRYNATRIGDAIDVTYAWSAPDTASLDPDGDRLGGMIFSTIGAIAALITLGFGWWMIGRKMSIIRALRSGEVREARVTALRETNVRKNKIPQFVLDWVDATGQSGTSMMSRVEKLIDYPVGSVIVVYVDPKTDRAWWEVQV